MKISKILEKYKKMPVQVKASFWFLICAFLQKGITVLTTPIFTRLLSTVEYGQYGVFYSWLGIATIFISLNLYAGVYTQGLVKFESERKIFSSSLQGLTFLLVVAWTGIYFLFQQFWNELLGLTTVQVLAMLVLIWTSSVFNFWASEQRVLYRYRVLVTVTLLVSICKPVVGILFVILAEDKATARILAIVLVELIAYSGLFVVQMLRGKVFCSRKFWKYALLYNLPLIPHYLSQTVLNSADRIMIRDMIGNSEAGIYSLAYSISQIMTLFNSALSQTLNPWMYQKIKEKNIGALAPVAYTSLILIAAVNLLLIAFAPEAVAIFAPAEYYEAIWVIPPVAMSVYFMYSYDLFAKFAFYYEKTKLIMYASVAGALLNVGLNYIFIGKLGYIAAGYTTLICYITYCVGHYLFMNKVCDEYCDGVRPYEHKKILGITLLFLIAGFVLLMTYHYILLRYGIIVIAGVFALIKRKRIIEIIQSLLNCRK